MADSQRVPWRRFPARPDPQDRVARDFRVYELTRSALAERLRIDNGFAGAQELRAAVYLCRAVLQPLRDEFGPFSPLSVYRSQALERALKKKPKDWVSPSQHTRGEACDVRLPGIGTLALARWVARNLPFDQLILECFDAAQGPHSGWVHVSLKAPGRGENRRQQLSYVPDGRGWKYVAGLRGAA